MQSNFSLKLIVYCSKKKVTNEDIEKLTSSDGGNLTIYLQYMVYFVLKVKYPFQFGNNFSWFI